MTSSGLDFEGSGLTALGEFILLGLGFYPSQPLIQSYVGYNSAAQNVVLRGQHLEYLGSLRNAKSWVPL